MAGFIYVMSNLSHSDQGLLKISWSDRDPKIRKKRARNSTNI